MSALKNFKFAADPSIDICNILLKSDPDKDSLKYVSKLECAPTQLCPRKEDVQHLTLMLSLLSQLSFHQITQGKNPIL